MTSILGSSYVLGAVLDLLALVVCITANLLGSVASSLGEVLCTRLFVAMSLVSYWRRQAEIRGRVTLFTVLPHFRGAPQSS